MKVKILKGKGAIRKNLKLYRFAMFHADKHNRECLCPECGTHNLIEEIETCEHCGRMICPECRDDTYDEAIFCKQCVKETEGKG